MEITKIGHCCLVIDVDGVRLMTDPGGWTSSQREVRGLAAVLITHEHPDHLHVESLKTVLVNNPQAKVITNTGVGAMLEAHSIPYQLVEDQQSTVVGEVLVEGFGSKHAPIYPGVPEVINTGYFIAEQLYYPGDSFHKPGKTVRVLALPIAGPWMRLAQALDFAKDLEPQLCFPVHDGMLDPVEWLYRHPARLLPEAGIQFEVIEPGMTKKV